jgi:hypothetical protein
MNAAGLRRILFKPAGFAEWQIMERELAVRHPPWLDANKARVGHDNLHSKPFSHNGWFKKARLGHHVFDACLAFAVANSSIMKSVPVTPIALITTP